MVFFWPMNGVDKMVDICRKRYIGQWSSILWFISPSTSSLIPLFLIQTLLSIPYLEFRFPIVGFRFSSYICLCLDSHLSTEKVTRSYTFCELSYSASCLLFEFQGLMVVEINEDALPVALEMHQGCPSSDAWLLLRRVKFFTTEASRHHLPLDPINLSP